MSYDVTGGGPMEAPIVVLSVPALKLIQSHLDIHKNVKSSTLFGCCTVHINHCVGVEVSCGMQGGACRGFSLLSSAF